MLSSLMKRFSALADKSALILIVPALLMLFMVDRPMALTLLQWLIFAPVMAGVAIIVSRIVFPQIHLTSLVTRAEQGNRAAALVASSIILFVALIVLALVNWAKA